MMFRSLLVLCFGLLAWSPIPSSAQNWTSFTPTEGMLTVQMPSEPKRSEIPIKGMGGPGRTILYTAVHDRAAFLVGWADYAPSFKFEVQAELAANRDNFVKGAGAVSGETKPITFKGSPGIEFTVVKSGEWVGRVRTYIINGKPYQLIALIGGSTSDEARITRFFDSFAVVPPR